MHHKFYKCGFITVTMCSNTSEFVLRFDNTNTKFVKFKRFSSCIPITPRIAQNRKITIENWKLKQLNFEKPFKYC